MKVKWGEWGYRVFPVVILLLLRVLLDLGKIGGWGFWLGNVLLAAGWIIGWMMAEGDHLMYALVCDPSSPTCSMVRTYMSKGGWHGKLWRLRKQREQSCRYEICCRCWW